MIKNFSAISRTSVFFTIPTSKQKMANSVLQEKNSPDSVYWSPVSMSTLRPPAWLLMGQNCTPNNDLETERQDYFGSLVFQPKSLDGAASSTTPEDEASLSEKLETV